MTTKAEKQGPLLFGSDAQSIPVSFQCSLTNAFDKCDLINGLKQPVLFAMYDDPLSDDLTNLIKLHQLYDRSMIDIDAWCLCFKWNRKLVMMMQDDIEIQR